MFLMFRCLLCWAAATSLLLMALVPAKADVDKALEEQGWAEFVFDDKLPNSFKALEDGGIEVTSRGGVSLLQMPLSVDLDTRPLLRWRWSVTEAGPATPLSTKGADDRSLAIFIAFPFVAEEATVFERMQRGLVELFAGKDAPGRVLNYVWGGEGDRGMMIDSPYLGESGMMQILRPARTATGQWFEENVNIADDYIAAFGSPPPDPIYIAISADSDDTQSNSRGTVTDLEFLDPARAF